MRKRDAGILFAAAALPVAAAAQVPLGSEFRVNNYTTGAQSYAAIASAPDTGAFIVAWTSMGQEGPSSGVFARRYSGGVAQGSAFQVNTYTTSAQNYPAVAADAAGNFVVVWTSYQGISAHEIFAQRYDAAGVPQGGEFRVNAYTTHVQNRPAVAMDPSGNFVVVWSGRNAGDFDGGIAGRLFDAAGNPLGGDFVVNTYTTGGQGSAAVAMDAIGRFTVAWTSFTQDGSDHGVFAQRFAANAAKAGPEFRVNSTTAGYQNEPAVAARSNGDFVFAWNSPDGNGTGTFARFWPASSGLTLGPEFRLNAYTTGNQQKPRVGFDTAGNVMAVWEAENQDGSGFGIFGRHYNAAIEPESAEFRINTYTSGHQLSPVVALNNARHFFVTWLRNDGDSLGIYAQRMQPDVILSDGFESGDLSAWSASSADSGDLSLSAAAALDSTNVGLQGFVDDTAGLWVQDDLPVSESRYRARFHFSTNDFDPGEALNHRRVRLLIGFYNAPTRRQFAIVLRRLGGSFAVMGRVRLDDDTQADTPFVPISSGAAHVVEIDWQRSTGTSANDGRFEMWVDGSPAAVLTNLDNNFGMVDYVRMGAISVKAGASGTLYWDEFESRRLNYIGP